MLHVDALGTLPRRIFYLSKMKYYVYILWSKVDNQFYTGYTKDIINRLNEHNNGHVVSTKNRRPLELIYWEGCLNQQDATRREKYLKSGNGKIYIKNRLKKYLESINPTG
jgi:putative endonuclease